MMMSQSLTKKLFFAGFWTIVLGLFEFFILGFPVGGVAICRALAIPANMTIGEFLYKNIMHPFGMIAAKIAVTLTVYYVAILLHIELPHAFPLWVKALILAGFGFGLSFVYGPMEKSLFPPETPQDYMQIPETSEG